jgi:hypothetical protein
MSVVFFTSIGGDLRLLGTQLEHYRALQVDRMLICLHLRQQDPDIVRHVSDVATAHGAILASSFIHPSYIEERGLEERQRILETFCHPEDWIVTADLDEFQRYPNSLQETISFCEQNGYDYAEGRLADRIAADGGFPELDLDNIWSQFPLEAALTKNITGGNCSKVVLSRAWARMGWGQHLIFDAHARGCPPDQVLVKVHHFKWDESVLQRLRERIPELKREGRCWWVESQAFLTYVEQHGGRLDLNDEKLAARTATELFA